MNDILNEIFSNQPLVAAFIGWFSAQILKIIVNIIREHRFDFKWLILTGGAVSSHTAGVSALATSTGIKFGFSSGYFAIAIVIASLVIFDARIIRRAAGRQAEVLNKIADDLYKKRGFKLNHLREFLGHTSLEVSFGLALGILIGILFTINFS